ncbi:MAG: biosynthetic arginine decarboxylase [Planctomycetota bacterium]
MDSDWTTDHSIELYKIDRWGLGYFNVRENGDLTVGVDGQIPETSIADVVDRASQQGIHAPLIVRIPGILEDRVRRINAAFNNAIDQFNYQGSYSCYYPVKVNPHRRVIETAAACTQKSYGGIEVGSKAELIGVLGTTDATVPLLCNGFKDESMIELALRGQQLGRKVTIVLEKEGELEAALRVAERIRIVPTLGVRVKLAARSGGRWNASGGAKSKFGLTVSQLLYVVDVLKERSSLQCLELLHFHPGSQISNVRKIKNSIVEASRIYSDLIRMGIELKTIDVGGGLAVDYTGERNIDSSSKNYSLQEYANDVVYYIAQTCLENELPHPNIISESGRAIAAHHSLLVIPVIENLRQEETTARDDVKICKSSNLLNELRLIDESLGPSNLSESFHDAQASMEAVWQMFSLGTLNLKQRSFAERMVGRICKKIASMLGELDFVPHELEDLRHQIADTYIANFSLFQAVPDSWALQQIFPVTPLQRLDEKPTRRAVIGDITCDSDGKIDCFIGADGGKSSLAVHELNEQPYYLGIFLIGAYQEALSDDHNLMGNFHVLTLRDDGEIELQKGATTADVLEHVDFNTDELKKHFAKHIRLFEQQPNVNSDSGDHLSRFFESMLDSYTYLDKDSSRFKSSSPHFQPIQISNRKPTQPRR